METQIMENEDGDKRTVYRYFIAVAGIHNKTKEMVFNSISEKIDEAKDSKYILFSITFEDDHMIMSINLDDIDKQKEAIKEMISHIADNKKDRRISIPDTGENNDMKIHLLYHRYYGAFCQDRMNEGGVFSDTQAI